MLALSDSAAAFVAAAAALSPPSPFAVTNIVVAAAHPVHASTQVADIDVRTIDQMRMIDRKMEIPHEGAFCDLMWSDPDDIETWAVSPRGAGWLFGAQVTQEFNQINGLELICRAHQLVQEGYKYMFNEGLVTVWSAPNYGYRCGNVAAILNINVEGVIGFSVFEPRPQHLRKVPDFTTRMPDYFL